jgi:hypothetical protein
MERKVGPKECQKKRLTDLFGVAGTLNESAGFGSLLARITFLKEYEVVLALRPSRIFKAGR